MMACGLALECAAQFNWRVVAELSENEQVLDIVTDRQGTLFARTSKGRVWYSQDQGDTWVLAALAGVPESAHVRLMTPDQASGIIIGALHPQSFGIYVSSEQGRYELVHSFRFPYDDLLVLEDGTWVVSYAQALWRTPNQGVDWNDGFWTPWYTTKKLQQGAHANQILAYGGGGMESCCGDISVSDDGGRTWTALYPHFPAIGAIALLPNGSLLVSAYGSGGATQTVPFAAASGDMPRNWIEVGVGATPQELLHSQRTNQVFLASGWLYYTDLPITSWERVEDIAYPVYSLELVATEDKSPDALQLDAILVGSKGKIYKSDLPRLFPTAVQAAPRSAPRLGIEAYPNPASDHLNVFIQSPEATRHRIELFDMLGRRVYASADGGAVLSERRLSINVSHLPAGPHVLVVQDLTHGNVVPERIVILNN